MTNRREYAENPAYRRDAIQRLIKAAEEVRTADTTADLTNTLNAVLAASATVLNYGGVGWRPVTRRRVKRGPDGLADGTVETIEHVIDTVTVTWIAAEELDVAVVTADD